MIMFRLIFFLLLICWMPVQAQRTYQVIDSLRKSIPLIAEDKQRDKALAFHELATYYMHVSNYLEAAANYARALTIANKLQDELLIAFIYRNMGTLAFNQSDYKTHMDYTLKALAIYEKRNDSTRMGALLKMIADNKLTAGDRSGAGEYYVRAIDIYKRTGDRLGEAMAYSNYSIVQYTNYEEKLKMALYAQSILDTAQTDNPIPSINAGNIGVAYLDIVRYDSMKTVKPGAVIPAGRKAILDSAEKYIRKAISMAQQTNNVDNEAYFTGVLAELQEVNGDYKNAYKNIRFYFEKNDSIYSQANKNEIAALQNKQEMDIKNAEISNQNLQINNQRTRMWYLGAGILLLMVIGVLFYRQSAMRRKNNIELQRLNAELAEANQVKARFFAILSHDLRSPIANLVSFLQLQQQRPGLLSAEKIKEHETKIAGNAQSLLETMEGMLLWSKKQMGNFKPVIKEVPVQSLFDYLGNFFGTTQGVNFSYKGADGLVLNTDENYVRTILQNLTSNAVKAVKNTASPAIEWKAWKQDAEIYLSIEDNGVGLSAEQVKAFLEPNAGTDSRHGLGSYIIRDLAAAIDCEIKPEPVASGTKVIMKFKITASPAIK
jgi:signal transduction histidine kinase